MVLNYKPISSWGAKLKNPPTYHRLSNSLLWKRPVCLDSHYSERQGLMGKETEYVEMKYV